MRRIPGGGFLKLILCSPGALRLMQTLWDVNAAILLLTALGYVDHAVTLLRKSPGAAAWWFSRNIEIERELMNASYKLGMRQIRNALWQQIRGIVPLARSRFGLLPFHRPERDY